MSVHPKYEGILSLSRPVSQKHPPMSREARAAQFAPFAALTGYDAALDEAGRLTQQKELPEEERLALLNEQLRLLQEHRQMRPRIIVTYFRPDDKKEGGAYVTLQGRFRQIDPAAKTLVLEDWQAVPLEALYALDSPLFTEETARMV
jgi:hypothetical protein